MAITKESIQKLVLLQEQDAVLDKLQGEMDQIPAKIADLRSDLESAKGRLNAAKAALIALEKTKKEKELDIAAKEEAIRKHGVELNQVKTNDAFKALQHEIDQDRAAVGEIETAILEAMEGIDAGRREEKAAAAELKGVEDEAKAEISVLEKQLEEIKARHDAQKALCDQAAADVPPEMLRIYRHARMRGKMDAVVPIEGGNCSACRIALAPQVVVEATKGKSLVVCESCQRILFKPEPAGKSA